MLSPTFQVPKNFDETPINPTRRHLLQSLCIGGVGLLLLPDLQACASSSDLRQEHRQAKNASFGLSPESVEILRLASLAPSSHNSQPWNVKILDDHHWIVSPDPPRCLPIIDPNRRELCLSVGAFLESLHIAAALHGLSPELSLPNAQPSSPWEVRVDFKTSCSKTIFSSRQLESRRTLREGLINHELNSAFITRLRKKTQTSFRYFPLNSAMSKRIAEATCDAFRQQTQNDKAQAELSRWIRFSEKDIAKHRDGLTPASMEIEGFAGWIVRHFYKPSDVLSADFRQKGIEKTEKQSNEGAGWLVLESQGDSVAELIDTGRRFQRLALAAQEQHLALHPMSQALEETPWREELAIDLGFSNPVQFILRCGTVESFPAPVSPRRSVGQILNLEGKIQ